MNRKLTILFKTMQRLELVSRKKFKI